MSSLKVWDGRTVERVSLLGDGLVVVLGRGEPPAESVCLALIDLEARESWLAGSRLSEDFPNGRVCALDEFAQTCEERFDDTQRVAIQTFLAALPQAQGVELSEELASSLAGLRDAIRVPLPAARAEVGRVRGRLESVAAVDRHGFWLTGSIGGLAPEETRLTAVAPEGARSVVLSKDIVFEQRPDELGFVAYVELDSPSRHPVGWRLELRGAAAEAVEDTCLAPVRIDDESAMAPVRALLDAEVLDEPLLDGTLLPALKRRARGPFNAAVDEVLEYGQPSGAPDVSILVAVTHRNRIEHQLSQFARDGQQREAELIFLAADPEPGEAVRLAEIVEELYDLYGTPFRLARLSRVADRRRALNLGAELARGRLLVLMSGDVLPAEPGWLGRLRGVLDSSPEIGVVGPKLLHEDNSIAYTSTRYVHRQSTPGWERRRPYVGLTRMLGAACVPKPVHAVSDQCLMIAASRFRAAGGLAELYLGDADAGAELCLRLAQDGVQTWYAPAAELYLVRSRAAPPPGSPASDRFDEWLFERRCGRTLAAIAPPPAREGPLPPPRTLGPAVPGSGSGRPGIPIEALDVTAAELRGDAVLDAMLVLPQRDSAGQHPLYQGTYSFPIAGWAVPRAGGPLLVEVHGHGGEPRQMVASLPSLQAAEKHPGVIGADASGFQFVIGSLSLPAEFELQVDALSEDGVRTALGAIRGRRRPIRSGYRPALQPLMVTMLGRSGSNWLITLLGSHPEILAYKPFVYEPMLASYWTAILRTLGDPASYIQALAPELYELDWWTGHGRRSPLPLHKPTTAMARWLGSESLEVLAAFCQGRLDDFYSEVARVQHSRMPRYFAEKCPPGTAGLIGELYPHGREIVLVRDFRDRIGSIVEYNAKRGLSLWGQDRSGTESEWFSFLRREATMLLDDWRARRDRAHLVRYEDLIADPRATLESALHHLGVDANAATIEQTLVRATETLPHAQQDHRTASSFEQSVGRWRADLSPAQQAACAEMFDDVLVEFGYEPTEGLGD